MSLPLSLDDLKAPFATAAGSACWVSDTPPTLEMAQHSDASLSAMQDWYRHAQQIEWAHLLAVEALWLFSVNPWDDDYRKRFPRYVQSVRAYNAEFNPEAK